MGKFFSDLTDRLKEGSSKAAIIFLAGMGGYAIAPDQIDNIVQVMGWISVLTAFFHKEKGAPDVSGALEYLKLRLSEKSSQLALIALAGLVGYQVTPEQLTTIAGILGSIGAILAIFRKEKPAPDTE